MCGWLWRGRGLQLWLLFACAVSPVFAASQAVVEMVQMPAWLDRAGRSQALAVDMEVKNGDRIRTGAAARVTLRLAEGSSVKLGEQATLGFYSRSLQPERAFKGALDVIKGGARFTTDALTAGRSSRDLAIRVGKATAADVGSNGAVDLWAKSDSERNLILLIEGKIRFVYAGRTVAVEQPMTLFVTPRNAAPPVDAEQFKRWARETEALAGDGMTGRTGQWKVLLSRAGSEAEALAIYDKARDAGYAAQIQPRLAGKAWLFDILLTRLASEQDAVVVANKVKSQLGYPAEPVLH